MQQLFQRIKYTSKSRQSPTTSPRTVRSQLAYERAKKAGTTKRLADEPTIKAWRYWRIIDNDFPYDIAYKIHHMLIPKRVARENQLTDEERTELAVILDQVSSYYDSYLVNFPKNQSVVDHYHIHLLKLKGKRSDFIL